MHTTLHIFRCGESDLYGLTHDETGANLPREQCAGGWRIVKSVAWDGSSSPWGLDVRWQEAQDAAKAGLSLNGFFLSDGAHLPEILSRP